MIPDTLELLTIFAGIYLLVSIVRLGILIKQFRASDQRMDLTQHRILERRETLEHYQLRNEKNQARSEVLHDRAEALMQRQEENAERLSATLMKLSQLLTHLENKLAEK